ncbi:alpha/beta hydrolase [Herbaspirillum camelliae]|uniref:alpha/beta hydrolase n=1 Tax=Herbaspirillum camelliae TaxID=1892903 RepID=UPI000949DE4F|nr:alpha/beta fold hydrolase [Herbaspirillum camelliae]
MTSPSEIVLLIHGLGGTGQDFGLMRSKLEESGFQCIDILLPGHGGQPADLLSTSADQWVEAVRKKIEALRQEYGTVHVIGMCMGALLAAQAAKMTDLGKNGRDRLILLAPPLFLDGWSVPWYRALRYVLYQFPLITRLLRYRERAPYGVKNPRLRAVLQRKFGRGDRFHYGWVPFRTIQELDSLRKQVREGLEQICCSTLLVHAVDDELTSLKSAQFIRDRINSEPSKKHARLMVLSDSYHMICIDNEREEVFLNVSKFLGTPA